MGQIRIMLVDDHSLFRSCLREVLDKHEEMEVMGEAANGREAIKLFAKLHPSVVVMDVAMPELNGIEATRQIMEGNGHAKVLALSMYGGVSYARAMIQAGASGYMLKTRPFTELVQAIRTVCDGKTYLTPEIAQVLVADYRMSRPGQYKSVNLTRRQREILQLVAEGYTTKAIASMVEVSNKTVESHRTQLMQKLELHGIAELTRYALQEGFTTFEVM